MALDSSKIQLVPIYKENQFNHVTQEINDLQRAIISHPVYQRLLMKRLVRKKLREKRANHKLDDLQKFNEESIYFELSDSNEVLGSCEEDDCQFLHEYQTRSFSDLITDNSELVNLAEDPSVEVVKVPSIYTDNDFTKNRQLTNKLDINQTDENKYAIPNLEFRDKTNGKRLTAWQNQIRKGITSSVKILRTLFENREMPSCSPKPKTKGKKCSTTINKDAKKTTNITPEEIEWSYEDELFNTYDEHGIQEEPEQKSICLSRQQFFEELGEHSHSQKQLRFKNYRKLSQSQESLEQDFYQNEVNSELDIQINTNDTQGVTEVKQHDELSHETNQAMTEGEMSIDNKEQKQLNYLFNVPEFTIEEESTIEDEVTTKEECAIKEEGTTEECTIEVEEKEDDTIENPHIIEKDNQTLSEMVYEIVNECEPKVSHHNVKQDAKQVLIERKIIEPNYIRDTQDYIEKDERIDVLENDHQKLTKTEVIISNEDNISTHLLNHMQDRIEPDQKEKNQQKMIPTNHYTVYEENCNNNVKENKDQVILKKINKNNQEMTNQHENKSTQNRLNKFNYGSHSFKRQDKYHGLVRQLQQLLTSELTPKKKIHGDYKEDITEDNRIQNLFEEVFLKWDEIKTGLSTFEQEIIQEMVDKLSENKKSELKNLLEKIQENNNRNNVSDSYIRIDSSLRLKRCKSEPQLYDRHDLVLPKRKDNTLISKIYLQLGKAERRNSIATPRCDDTSNRGIVRLNSFVLPCNKNEKVNSMDSTHSRCQKNLEPIKNRRENGNLARETRLCLENKRRRRFSMEKFIIVKDIQALEKQKIVKNMLSKAYFQEVKS